MDQFVEMQIVPQFKNCSLILFNWDSCNYVFAATLRSRLLWKTEHDGDTYYQFR